MSQTTPSASDVAIAKAMESTGGSAVITVQPTISLFTHDPSFLDFEHENQFIFENNGVKDVFQFKPNHISYNNADKNLDAVLTDLLQFVVNGFSSTILMNGTASCDKSDFMFESCIFKILSLLTGSFDLEKIKILVSALSIGHKTVKDVFNNMEAAVPSPGNFCTFKYDVTQYLYDDNVQSLLNDMIQDCGISSSDDHILFRISIHSPETETVSYLHIVDLEGRVPRQSFERYTNEKKNYLATIEKEFCFLRRFVFETVSVENKNNGNLIVPTGRLAETVGSLLINNYLSVFSFIYGNDLHYQLDRDTLRFTKQLKQLFQQVARCRCEKMPPYKELQCTPKTKHVMDVLESLSTPGKATPREMPRAVLDFEDVHQTDLVMPEFMPEDSPTNELPERSGLSLESQRMLTKRDEEAEMLTELSKNVVSESQTRVIGDGHSFKLQISPPKKAPSPQVSVRSSLAQVSTSPVETYKPVVHSYAAIHGTPEHINARFTQKTPSTEALRLVSQLKRNVEDYKGSLGSANDVIKDLEYQLQEASEQNTRLTAAIRKMEKGRSVDEIAKQYETEISRLESLLFECDNELKPTQGEMPPSSPFHEKIMHSRANKTRRELTCEIADLIRHQQRLKQTVRGNLMNAQHLRNVRLEMRTLQKKHKETVEELERKQGEWDKVGSKYGTLVMEHDRLTRTLKKSEDVVAEYRLKHRVMREEMGEYQANQEVLLQKITEQQAENQDLMDQTADMSSHINSLRSAEPTLESSSCRLPATLTKKIKSMLQTAQDAETRRVMAQVMHFTREETESDAENSEDMVEIMLDFMHGMSKGDKRRFISQFNDAVYMKFNDLY
ncbi:hypothetical protein PCE1_005021 [Barthelona sp. PCE]